MIIWSMFDGSGLAALPWAERGHTVYCINYDGADHGAYSEAQIQHENIVFINHWIHSLDGLASLGLPDPDFIMSFPPCTDIAVSGARWFAEKLAKDPDCQNRAIKLARLAEYASTLLYGCPYFVENPRSILSTRWRKNDRQFHPWQYGGYLPDDDVHPFFPEYIADRDAYPKETWLWVGGGFIMPESRPVPVDAGYSKQYQKLGGKSARTKMIRSLTPRGFALAVVEANEK